MVDDGVVFDDGVVVEKWSHVAVVDDGVVLNIWVCLETLNKKRDSSKNRE